MTDQVPQTSKHAPPPLEIEGVTYRYPGAETDAVSRIDLRVERGSCVGVLGPNGGGKTTLVRLALGLLEPSAGRVRVSGVTAADARARGEIGYVSQHRPRVAGIPLSVEQFVALSVEGRLAGLARPSRAQREAIERSLELTGTASLRTRPVGALSGGQLQRAMIARAIAPCPALLLLDEPTVGIDVAGQAAFAALLEAVRGDGRTGVLVVSHDLRAVVAGCDRIACLSRTLHAHVSPQGLTPQVLAEVFAHEVEGVLGEVHVDAHLASDCAHEHGPPSSGRSDQGAGEGGDA